MDIALWIPDIIPKEARHKGTGTDLVQHIRVNEPILEGLIVDNGLAGVVPHIKTTRNFAAVAAGSCAVAISMRVAWRLLLAMVQVATEWRVVVVVALRRSPWAVWFE